MLQPINVLISFVNATYFIRNACEGGKYL